jgi:HAD superfamily hydrolase (TIGR01509 family)
MRTAGVIFDIDGTLVDNHAYHEEAWLLWGARNGKPIDRSFYRERLYARTNDVIFRTIYGPEISAHEIRRRAAEKEAIYREIYGPAMKTMPGLIPLLDALRRADIPCAAASNAERINVDFVIDGLNLRNYFRAVLAREDVARGKPEPDLFLLAAERLGVPPERCCVFEDSWAGFEAARRAGMAVFAIGTPHDHTPPPYVISAHADFRTVRLEDIVSASARARESKEVAL